MLSVVRDATTGNCYSSNRSDGAENVLRTSGRVHTSAARKLLLEKCQELRSDGRVFPIPVAVVDLRIAFAEFAARYAAHSKRCGRKATLVERFDIEPFPDFSTK